MRRTRAILARLLRRWGEWDELRRHRLAMTALDPRHETHGRNRRGAL